MKITSPPFAFLTLCLLFLAGCTDPITVGSDLLDADRASVGQTMEIPFTTRVVREDSVLTYNASTINVSSSNTVFSFGRLEDEVFGTADHSVYIAPTLPRGADGLARAPGFAGRVNVRVDSAVLILPIDTSKAFYGPGRTFPFRLTELMESFELLGDDYYSSVSFQTGTVSLARDNRFTASREPTLVHDTAVVDSFVRSHVRIRFDDAFVQRINNLTTADFASDTIFRAAFGGVHLRADGPTDALVNIMPPSANQGQSAFSGFYFYYPDTADMSPTFYRAPFQLWLPNYTKDYTGSLVGELLDEQDDNELVALAGQAGLMTEITFPDLSVLTGKVINRATFTFPVAETDDTNYDDYPLPTRVELFYRAGDGTLLPIADRLELIRTQSREFAIDFFLDGLLRDEVDGPGTYSPTFSIHLQQILRGEVENRLFLRVTPLRSSEFRATRALLNGPAATGRSATLSVTFTELD